MAALILNPPEAPDPNEIKEWQDALAINSPILAGLVNKVEALATGQAPKFFPENCAAFPGEEICCPKGKAVALPGKEAPNPDKVKKLKADLQEQREQVERLEVGLKKALDKKADYEKYTSTRQVLADRIVYLKEVAEIDMQAKALDSRMQNGRDLLEAVNSYHRLMKETEAARAEVASAGKEVTLYDTLAKALAPDGIPSQLIAEALEPINKLLKFASGYLFPEQPDNPIRLTKDLEVVRDVPYALLSKSARYRTGIAFQVALAKLAGARLLMIDECDVLDPPNRAALIDLLLAIRQDFDTILVFATSDHADASNMPEIQVWWMEDGKVSPVRAKEAA